MADSNYQNTPTHNLMIWLPHIEIAVTFRTVTYVVTHESTQNETYLHNYEITCNLFFIVEYH